MNYLGGWHMTGGLCAIMLVFACHDGGIGGTTVGATASSSSSGAGAAGGAGGVGGTGGAGGLGFVWWWIGLLLGRGSRRRVGVGTTWFVDAGGWTHLETDGSSPAYLLHDEGLETVGSRRAAFGEEGLHVVQ